MFNQHDQVVNSVGKIRPQIKERSSMKKKKPDHIYCNVNIENENGNGNVHVDSNVIQDQGNEGSETNENNEIFQMNENQNNENNHRDELPQLIDQLELMMNNNFAWLYDVPTRQSQSQSQNHESLISNQESVLNPEIINQFNFDEEYQVKSTPPQVPPRSVSLPPSLSPALSFPETFSGSNYLPDLGPNGSSSSGPSSGPKGFVSGPTTSSSKSNYESTASSSRTSCSDSGLKSVENVPKPGPKPSALNSGESNYGTINRPLPVPPKDIPPPKPPHLPPDYPPPKLPLIEPSSSPPPQIPPRIPIIKKMDNQNLGSGYARVNSTKNKNDKMESKCQVKSHNQDAKSHDQEVKMQIQDAKSQKHEAKSNFQEVKKQNQDVKSHIQDAKLEDCKSQIKYAQESDSLTSNSLEKSGFLWKTGSNRREFKERWCVLKNKINDSVDELGYLIYYLDQKSIHSRGRIWLKDIAFVNCSPQLNFKSIKLPQSSFYTTNFYYLEIGSTSHKGRVFLFGVNSLQDHQKWTSALMNSIAWKTEPQFINLRIPSTLVPPKQYGFLHVKHGISGQWMVCWVILSDKFIKIYSKNHRDDTEPKVYHNVDDKNKNVDRSQVEDEDEFTISEFDLRKMMSIFYASVHQISSCSIVIEPGQPLCLTFPQKVLYLQSELKSHTESWFQSIQKCWKSNPESGLLQDQYLSHDNIPVAIDKCLNFISTYGLDTPNLYTSNHFNTSSMQDIVDQLKHNPWDVHLRVYNQGNSGGYSVHDVTTAMLKYLRSMNECILTEKLYHDWIKANEIEQRNERLEQLKLLVRLLPNVNYLTLKKIIAHFVCVLENSDKNNCSILSLAPVLCSNILFMKVNGRIVKNKFEGTSSAGMDIICDLILSYSWLFDVTSEELEKERKIQRALEMLKGAKGTKSVERTFSDPGTSGSRPKIDFQLNEFLIGVYIYNKQWGKCLNVKLNHSMTSQDLIEYCIKNGNLKEKQENLSVFEVICNDQMERPLHHTDIVLGVTLAWSKWPNEDAKDNYLCLKKNDYIYDHIKPYLTQPQLPITMFSELKFADRNSKSFKKVLFEFIGAKLTCYRDAKSDKPLGQWNIEDIIWYLGAEKKRSPPNQLVFTFIERDLFIKRTKEFPYFGRTICCNNEEEYYKWIAAMLLAEFPSGVLPVKAKIDLLL